MKLTKDQIQALKSLKNHPGYQVLIMIEEDARHRMWDYIINANLEDKDQLEVIKANQIYCKARQDFLNNLDNATAEIYSPNI